MSGKKSFSSETSERYALALFELSLEDKSLEQVENNVKDFLHLYKQNDELKNFIKNPTNEIQIQFKVISEISKIMKFSKVFKNFLLVLIEKRRIFYLENIINNFFNLTSKKQGKINASLVSAKKLTETEIGAIADELSKVIGKSISFNYKFDEELIGGLKVQVGSLMIDSSIKNKLKKYEQLMLEN